MCVFVGGTGDGYNRGVPVGLLDLDVVVGGCALSQMEI